MFQIHKEDDIIELFSAKFDYEIDFNSDERYVIREILMNEEENVSQLNKNDQTLDKENNQTAPKEHPGRLCEYCGDIFRSRQVFHQHRQIHTNVRSHKCNLCTKAFRRRQHLIVHQNTHSQARRFGCILCNKRYKNQSGLSNHTTRIHNNIRC